MENAVASEAMTVAVSAGVGGIGTTFKIYLPPAAQSALAGLTAAPARSTASRDGTETILLVEDEEMLRPLVAEVLESYGYTVRPAANAEEAIALADGTDLPIDLLLTDVVMPGMNGQELADALLAKRPSLNVLFTSGYPAGIIDRHGIAEAHVAFIQKPFLADELAAKIRELLDEAA